MKTAFFKTFKEIASPSDTWHRAVRFENEADKEALIKLCHPVNPFELKGVKLGRWIYEVPGEFPRRFLWRSHSFITLRFKEEDARYALSGGKALCAD